MRERGEGKEGSIGRGSREIQRGEIRVDFNCVSRRNRLLPGNSSNLILDDGSFESRAIIYTNKDFYSINTLRRIDI